MKKGKISEKDQCMFTAKMDQDIGRPWDEEEDNLKNKIEKFWVEDDQEAYVGFASDNLQANRCFDRTGNGIVDAGGVGSSKDSGCRRVLLSPRFNLREVDSRPLLGLTLTKTPSFVSLLATKVSTPNVPTQDRQVSDHHRPRATMDYVASQPLSEKLKASNFPISTIKIGAWRRMSMREGDLTGKLYYAKRKLVWEILDGQLKSKMEILWSDITAIKAVVLQNQPGILQIELDKPPLFFCETTPEPRKHTTWQQAPDFTGGQAPLYRRHVAIFPPGALDKHYEKLLQCDQHLLELSQKPFPSEECPYFNTVMPLDISGLPVNFNGLGSRFTPVVQQYPYPPYPTTSRAAPLNPTITVNTPNRNGGAENRQLAGQTVWDADQRMHFPTTNLYFEEPSPTTGKQAYPRHNYQLNVVMLNEIEKHLLGDTQIVCPDNGESTRAAQVQPLFVPNDDDANHSGMDYRATNDDSVDQVMMMMMMQNATDHNVQIVQPMNWLQPHLQGSNESVITMESEAVDNFVPSGNNLANGDLYSTMYRNH